MPPDLEKKYKELFDLPELFMMDGRDIKSIKYEPGGRNNPVTMVRASGKMDTRFER